MMEDTLTDGTGPSGPLVWDAQGNLYGTTGGGGSDRNGTVFTFSPSSHTETVFHDFSNNANGAVPNGGVIFDTQGNLYGVTIGGGAYNHGTIYKISPSGADTVLYSFTGGADGFDPRGPLVIDAHGNLYGTTNETVFKLTP